MATGRDRTIDVARGLAMVAVVAGHALRGLQSAGIAPGAGAWSDLGLLLYLVHLPMFALLTGLLLPAGVDRDGAARYLRRRVPELLYLFVLWTLIQGAFEIAASSLRNGRTTWLEVLTLWVPIAHLWFLPLLVVAVTTVALVSPWRGGPARVVATLAVIAVSLAGWGVDGAYVWERGAALLMFFAAGAWITRARFSGVVAALPPLRLALVALCGGAVLVAIAGVGDPTAPTMNDPTRTARTVAQGLVATTAGVGGLLALSAIVARFSTVSGWLSHIGARSLPIFLMHILFTAGTRAVLVAVGLADPRVQLVLGTAAGVVGPLLALRALRRAPWVFHAPWVVRSTRSPTLRPAAP